MTIRINNREKPIPIAWYKSRWFLTLCNALVAIIGSRGIGELIFLWKPHAPVQSNIVIFASLIGCFIGCVLGYTLWATLEDFSRSSMLKMSLLWAIALGGIFLVTGKAILCSGFFLPIIALLLSFRLLPTARHIGSLVASIGLTFIIGVTISALVTSYIPNMWNANARAIFLESLVGIPISGILGGIFGWTLVHFLQIDLQYHAIDRHHQEVAMGMHMDGTYIVGDDGELIPLTEDDDKANVRRT